MPISQDIVPVVPCEQIQENEWHLHNIWLVAPKYREMKVINLEYLCISINLYKWGYGRRNQMRFENIEEFDDDELHSLRIPLGDYLVEIISGKSDEHRTSKFNVSRRTLERILQIARKCLTVDFMPLYLGLVHLTRDDTHVLDQISLYKWGYGRRNQMNFVNIEEFDDDELHSQRTPALRMRSDFSATALGDYLVEIITGESDEYLTSKFNMSSRTLE
ncbi:hypothetical protein SFRURICE_011860 [Spodoptera frugiperda]|nr:hypothetical protein SFRURICE_011860 [Spodoptera frugiperda]